MRKKYVRKSWSGSPANNANRCLSSDRREKQTHYSRNIILEIPPRSPRVWEKNIVSYSESTWSDSVYSFCLCTGFVALCCFPGSWPQPRTKKTFFVTLNANEAQEAPKHKRQVQKKSPFCERATCMCHPFPLRICCISTPLVCCCCCCCLATPRLSVIELFVPALASLATSLASPSYIDHPFYALSDWLLVFFFWLGS